MDDELKQIFALLAKFLMSLGFSSSKKKNRHQSNKQPLRDLPAGNFQSPLKSSWVNLGDFLPGVNINATHKNGHYGIDMQAPKGTAVYAFAPGKVLNAGASPGNEAVGGITVTILHRNNLMTYYAHLSSVSVEKGQLVNTDTQIGTVGNTGNAKNGPPHLHFEVHAKVDPKNPTSNWNGTAVAPSNYIAVPAYAKRQPAEEKRIA